MSDSLGGAIYNASMSVDVNELDFMDTVTLTNNGPITLHKDNTSAESYFGLQTNRDGTITFSDNRDTTFDTEDYMLDAINSEINKSKQVIEKIKKENPNTKISDKDLVNMYNTTMNPEGMIII